MLHVHLSSRVKASLLSFVCSLLITTTTNTFSSSSSILKQNLVTIKYNMALEAVVFPQDLFVGNCSLRDLCGYDFANLFLEFDEEKQFEEVGGVNLVSSSENGGGRKEEEEEEEEEKEVVVERKKRRRARRSKNKEEVENQRMTHIAVERNRRRIMNEHLAVLRCIMPPGYVPRSDQASIVGGAINFVKELEQLLQTLEAQRHTDLNPTNSLTAFTIPHYSSNCSNAAAAAAACSSNNNINAIKTLAENKSSVADIEVSMIKSHANLKILSRRRPKQLLLIVAGLENLRLVVLHLNVSTVDQMVLYSFSLKVEDDCLFKSVDDIMTAVYQMVGQIEEKSVSL